MVLAARLAPAAFASDKIGPEMIGRWAAGLARGRWRHEDISAEPPVRGELWIGFAAHYFTGIILTQVYLAAAGRGGPSAGRARRPSPTEWPPACCRSSSCTPRWATGVAAGGAATPAASCARCSLGHVGFGVGIGLWAATRRRG